ncbi:MAG: dTDP-4-amino-4,6-dideoxygalactose transaminase [Bacilli bacterium]|jgi:dTDP-4-amino-4,6-dideoxygalactose transaminase
MIPFNKPPYVDNEIEFLKEAISNLKLCGDGPFTHKCSQFFEEKLGAPKVLMTNSGTSALEIAARLLDLTPGDEVIMPSYTFSSTANAFVQVGAKIVFVDIEPQTMNISPNDIEKAINPKTKAIVVVHYAGVGCDMDKIMEISRKHDIPVVEDAAQAVNAFFNNKPLGTFGLFGCYSFHETKNYSMGEGGAIIINDSKYIEKAEILREKGTNRSKMLRGQIDKYSWVEYGSSYLPSELNVAFLYAQLLSFDQINNQRLKAWNRYYSNLKDLSENKTIEIPFVPSNCCHNAHMFYIKCKNLEERTNLISYLHINGIASAFHYVPLHSAPAGIKYGYFCGEDVWTTKESEKLVRLPLFLNIKDDEIDCVVDTIKKYYRIVCMK